MHLEWWRTDYASLSRSTWSWMSRGSLLLLVVAGLGVLTITLSLVSRQDTDREQVHKQVRSSGVANLLRVFYDVPIFIIPGRVEPMTIASIWHLGLLADVTTYSSKYYSRCYKTDV